MGADLSRRRVGKRAATNKLGADEIRDITVSPRLNKIEAAELDERRAPVKMSRGEYMRACTFGTLPRTVPEINRKAWAQLARLSANINQYQSAINAGTAGGYPPALLGQVIDLVEQLRREMIGVSRAQPDADEDDEDESIAR